MTSNEIVLSRSVSDLKRSGKRQKLQPLKAPYNEVLNKNV
jgi:hypothetical protein